MRFRLHARGAVGVHEATDVLSAYYTPRSRRPIRSSIHVPAQPARHPRPSRVQGKPGAAHTAPRHSPRVGANDRRLMFAAPSSSRHTPRERPRRLQRQLARCTRHGLRHAPLIDLHEHVGGTLDQPIAKRPVAGSVCDARRTRAAASRLPAAPPHVCGVDRYGHHRVGVMPELSAGTGRVLRDGMSCAPRAAANRNVHPTLALGKRRLCIVHPTLGLRAAPLDARGSACKLLFGKPGGQSGSLTNGPTFSKRRGGTHGRNLGHQSGAAHGIG